MSVFPTTLNPLPGTSAYPQPETLTAFQDPRSDAVKKYDEAGDRAELLSTISFKSDAAIIASINRKPAEYDLYTIRPFDQPSGDYSSIIGVAGFYTSLVQSGLTGLFGNASSGRIGLDNLQALLGIGGESNQPTIGGFIDSFA